MAMDVKYGKDELNYYQSLTITVNAPLQHVFSYLEKTETIQKWFPQLSFENREDKLFLRFNLGDGQFEEMKVLEFHHGQSILLEWGHGGEVKIELNPLNDNQTYLTIDESLPNTFANIAQDFTGWQYQLLNIKHIAETGTMKPTDHINFKEAEEKTAMDLDLL